MTVEFQYTQELVELVSQAASDVFDDWAAQQALRPSPIDGRVVYALADQALARLDAGLDGAQLRTIRCDVVGLSRDWLAQG